MKHRIALFVVALVVVALPAYAQQAPATSTATGGGFKWDFINVSGGEDALATGITAIFRLKDGNRRTLEIALQQEQSWVLFGPKYKLGQADVFVAASAGFQQGAPWAGPFLTVDMPLGNIGGQKVSFSTLHWPCFFFGQWEPTTWKNDDRPNTEKLKLGYLAIVQLSVGPLGFSYGALNFLNDPWNALPRVSYTKNIRSDLSLIGSVTRNVNKHSWMLLIGGEWHQNQ
ncbi:MAG: hypothetical protein UT53_C0014G0008 [Candidatus Yanofskybacteria bacterium GW2011_GWD2_39_48]|uniref:Uncharacterized protein n=1 Tax=Candidatus Yanofskybacteria bacterium GW2011_GWD2_39_48 TaxID=1619031 RepID=A0A0G0RM23_9BACT|nr:MAG: hypothetical protein UT53_C0014G0008 [Candidatus Yanofskybacteria bacterium GW2011_GWD2_39_48]